MKAPYNKRRLRTCQKVAGYPRFHTWALVEAAHSLNNRMDSELIIKLLIRADGVLTIRGRGVNDPVIAEDLGGDEVITDLRRRIQKAIEHLKCGEIADVRDELWVVRKTLYLNAIKRLFECVHGDESPSKGVSTRKRIAALLE